MIYLRQSTASQEVLLGPFLDDTDGKTAETALTINNTDIKVWKAGGTSESNKNSGGATHIAGGRYYAVLDATDTDTVGPLILNVHVSGALPVRLEITVLEEAVYDQLFAASAAGYQVPIWSGPTATVALTNTTISTSQSISSVTGSVGSVSGNVGGNVAGSVASVAAGGITASSFAAGAITATVIATGAIDADALAADAGTEIGTSVWANATRTLTAATNITSTGAAVPITVGGLVSADAVAINAVSTSSVTTISAYIGNSGAVINGTNLNTLSSHDPGATLGTSTLTQAQVTGGAYALNSASFAFNSALDLTTTQKASVNAEADTALADYDPPTNAEMVARTLVAADYATAAALAVVDGIVDKLDTAMELDGGVYRFTTNALEQAPTGGGTPQTGDAYAYLVSNLGAAGASATEAGGTGDHLTAVPWNAAWDAEVESEVADGLAAYDPPTNAEMEARTLVAASYATASALDAVDNFVDTEVAAIKAVTDKLDTAVELDGGVYRFTTNALEQAPTGGGDPLSTAVPGAYGVGTAGYVLGTYLNAAVSSRSSHSAADVWSVAARTLTAATNITSSGATIPMNGTDDGVFVDVARIKGSMTAAANFEDFFDGTGYTPVGIATEASLATVAGYLDTEIAAILADTNELQTDWVNGGRLDLLIDAIKAKTDNLPASFPANFASLGINASGHVSRVTVVDSVTSASFSLGTDSVTAASMSAAAANKIADHIMRRALSNARASSNGDVLTFRSILGAISKLVNRLERNGASLETYEEDDATIFGSQTIGTDTGAAPITSLNTD